MLMAAFSNMLREIAARLPTTWVEKAYDLKYRGLPVPHRLVRPHSMLSNLNLFFLQELAHRVIESDIHGDFVECGVYRGGSAGILAYEAMRANPVRSLWLFDVFGGYPAPGPCDGPEMRELARFKGSLETTRRILQRVGYPIESVNIIQGRIEETTPRALEVPVALLHIDCNFFDAVRVSLETFYDRIPVGGYVVFNDYGCYEGCREAADGFFHQRGAPATLTRIDREAYYLEKH